MTSLFISDLHLSADQPETVRAFFRFMDGPARNARALYILGDLFEYWAGDDFTDPFNKRVMDALAGLSRHGVQLHFMPGNRDFLIDRRFARAVGATLLKDPSLVEIDGKAVLLMHGDRLCVDDHAYQAFRRKRDHPVTRTLFRLLPLSARRAIFISARKKSETVKMQKAASIMDVSADAVAEALRRHGHPLIIHGHTHRPARHEHVVDGRASQRWVLPDWHGKANWLEFEHGRCRLREE